MVLIEVRIFQLLGFSVSFIWLIDNFLAMWATGDVFTQPEKQQIAFLVKALVPSHAI